ncbi:cell envelope integrity protein TolA [Rhizobium mesosinicum]|uniref:Cell envelope integrity protein TolA n=1 Tax=Rhizobium mesosinicum TaxID=335017 RepID=A0ABS7GVF7_9HYPH|nr:cell envelope integrity protein TolA [Rhizobium mesosinicum]MBW9053792.1 cell envelope integrity protein TolA [Rhizobium mesosinicum]
MLTDLSNGNKSLAAAVVLGTILGCAFEASAQSAGAATDDTSVEAIRRAVAMYFNVPAGLLDGGKVLITVHLKLSRTGAINGAPLVTASGGDEAARQNLSVAALRAVQRASPFTTLPKDKYESWKEVVLRFEPGDPTP